MSNKKIFKELYSKKINKNNNYKAILKSIERNNMKRKNNMLKWAFVPVCLIMVICGILFLNNNGNDIIYKPSDPIISSEKNYEIYINSIESNEGLAKFDADVQRLDIKVKDLADNLGYEFLEDIVIPKDLNNNVFSAIYVKETKDSDNYSVLNNYDFWYENSNDERRIILSFSDKYEPLRDYFFDDERSKVSKINDFELTIYKYKNSYMTTFTYNNINFDIETNDITQQELIDLLTSIIK